MKVLVLASLGYSLLNFRASLLGEMAAAGHQVVACAPEDDDEVRRGLARLGVRYLAAPMHRASISPLHDLRTLKRLVETIRAERPDAILAYTQKPIVYGGLAARIVGAPRFFAMVTGLGYTFVESDGLRRRALRGLVSALFRMALARAAAVIVFNEDDRETLAAAGALPTAVPVARVAGSGVDLERFAPAPIPPGPPAFLLIARLLEDKGLREYVRAAGVVRAVCPEARIRILGPLDPNPAGVRPEELDRWIAEGVVEYLGETRDVRPYLAQASVYVLPSYREGMPRTVLEAMAMGRPVVTTNAPGCRDAVIDGRSGFLVPPRDAGALAAAMLRFVRAPELAAQMGRLAREDAESRFDVRKVNAALLRILRLDGPRAGLSPASPKSVSVAPLSAGGRG